MRASPHAAIAFFITLILCAPAPAQIKENLDLPFDALGENEEEEEAPEIVNFYSTNLEGDGFFYVIDRSSSMRDSGEIQKAKAEVNKNISEFSNRVQFGIVFFDAGLIKFPSNGQPAEANEAMKQAAKGWVNAVQGGSGSCCMQGLLAGLQFANRAKSRRKVIVYLGDGGGHCGGDEQQYLNKTLGTVTSQNYQRIKINTIGVLDVAPHSESFLRKLAASNGGTYTRIN
jgi:Mg-chelatase subunit ChlD